SIHNLVGVMMTPNKLKVMNATKTALLKMTKKSVPALGAAMTGSDPEFAGMQADWGADKGYIITLADVLSYTSTKAAQEILIQQSDKTDNDKNRAALTQTLVLFPTDQKAIEAFKASYGKLPAIADKGGDDTGRERSGLLQVAVDFYDPNIIPWILN